MIKMPFMAFTKFLNAEIEILAPHSRDELVDPIKVQAVVMQGNPFSLESITAGEDALPSWAVMLENKDIDIPVGSTIKATKSNPRLFVRSVHALHECLWLDCVSKGEKGN